MRGIYIALGSNEGDRAQFLARALEAMRWHDIEIVKQSSIYESPALMPENAPETWNKPFLNQVIEINTTLKPKALLVILKYIEKRLGRQLGEHWAPRPIDLDLLAYHAIQMDTPALCLPHRHFAERDFVLVPWVEIAPQWYWNGRSLSQMLAKLQHSDALLYAA